MYVMQSKLTLRLDSELIEQAKAYARSTGRSVSELVAGYFALLGREVAAEEASVPAAVRSLHGRLAGADADERDYRAHLEAKYGGAGR